MTRYEQGFLTKCAEYGVGVEQAVELMKMAGPAGPVGPAGVGPANPSAYAPVANAGSTGVSDGTLRRLAAYAPRNGVADALPQHDRNYQAMMQRAMAAPASQPTSLVESMASAPQPGRASAALKAFGKGVLTSLSPAMMMADPIGYPLRMAATMPLRMPRGK